MEQEAVGMAMLADIGGISAFQGEVGNQVAHQRGYRARERKLPAWVLTTPEIDKGKHLEVLPWTKILIRLTFPATAPSWMAGENLFIIIQYITKWNREKGTKGTIILPGQTP
jgi:hypothetical protein